MKRLLSVSIALALLFVTTSAFARTQTLTLALSAPPEVELSSQKARMEVARLAAQRLRKRLEMAGVKHAKVDVVDAATLKVEVHGHHERAWLRGLLTSRGLLEIRPVHKGGPNWLALAREMPAGLEIRGEVEPFLWSSRRALLEKFLSRLSFSDYVVLTSSHEQGWRSIALGSPVATHRQLQNARAITSSTGTYFVRMEFAEDLSEQLAGSGASDVEMYAVVLDGEVLGLVGNSALTDRQIQLTPPRGPLFATRKQRRAWATQVAGRLAAPLPIPLAVLEE